MAVKLLDKGNLVRNLVNNYKLVPHIDRIVGEGDFPWEFKYEEKGHDDAWHPSGDCTPSVYELYLGATGQGEARRFSGSLYKTFMVGHFWHQYLQHIVLKKLGFCDEAAIERRGYRWWGEVKPSLTDGVVWDDIGLLVPAYPEKPLQHRYARPQPYHWATGSGDIAPCTIPGHGDYIVDFKTMNAMDFRKQHAPIWTADKWEAQINIYMDFFDAEKALIVGICKDSPHDMKEFIFTRNQPLIDAIYLKWHLVSECLDEGIVPPEDADVELPLMGPIT